MGYLGMVGGPNPCADQIESVYAAEPQAFRLSPYGIAGFGFTDGYAPYLIDPATLEIEHRPDLAIGPFPSTDGQLNFACALDDSTMVFHVVGTGGTRTSRLRVLTRSGITIAMSAEQQSVVVNLGASVIMLDSTHILRRYETPPGVGFGSNVVVEVMSVSGGSLSVVASTTYAANNYTVSRDGGEAGGATVLIGSSLFPFHWNGSGTLYCYGFAAGSGGPRRIHAVPCSLGGSVTAPGLSWRSRDAQGTGGSMIVGKLGSSECVLSGQSGGAMGFYDDGSQMHYNATGVGSDMITAALGAEPNNESSWGDYLSPLMQEYPRGTPVPGTPDALVFQSGTALSYTPIEAIVRCFEVTGSDIGSPTRHDTALGAESDHLGAGIYRLHAFRW